MAAERYDLRGKTVLITGAGRGIGAEVARQLSRRGARLALLDLDSDGVQALAAELGTEAAGFEADVTDSGQLERAAEGAVERFGGVDVVIANAGIAPIGALETHDPEAFERTIEVNLVGVWRTVRAALPHVVERSGYVLVVSSLAAAIHPPLHGPYAAAKAGVEAYADILRYEIAPRGVKVGVAYFSYIDTEMVRTGLGTPAGTALQKSYAWPVSAISPVDGVGRAMVRGIERRSRFVVAPRWVRGVLMARGLMQPLIDVQLRARGADEAVRIANAEAGAAPAEPRAQARQAS